MPISPVYRNIDLKPLTGLMDTRSMPDSVPAGAWRWRQNISVNDAGRTCRRAGWQKNKGDRAVYNNEDLHDQLLSLQQFYDDTTPPYPAQDSISVYPPGTDENTTAYCGTVRKVRPAGRQPLNFLFSAISTSGERKLLAGTQNRIYAFNESKGNWKIIADAYGGAPLAVLSKQRWLGAQVKDTVVLTNNLDPVLAWIIDQPTFGCAMQSVAEIESLKEIALTKAAVVASWKGTLFLADVEMDGERVQSRLVWSNLEDPTSFVPSDASTAGFLDLNDGAQILAIKPLNDALLIYTTKGIWQCKFVGGDETFNFVEIYSEPENGEACLAYRHTLVSTGEQHVYLGRDGVYAFDLYMPRPDRVEWMHRATTEIFKTISEAHCENHIGTFNPALKEFWLSWIETGNDFPVRSLVFNTRFSTTDFVDAGFTAFVNHIEDDRSSILDFLLSELICLPEELAEQSDVVTLDVKEGGYCAAAAAASCGGANAGLMQCVDRNLPIWTKTAKDIDGRDVEDFDQPSPDANSLCAVLGDLNYEDLCQECARGSTFLMASAEDWTIKEYGKVYFREIATAFTPCGAWRRVGYDSIIRSAAMDFGWPKENKNTRSLDIEYETTQVQADPSALEARIGYSAQAIDSNLAAPGRCALVWRRLPPKDLACLSQRSGDEHITEGTRPAKTLHWSFFFTGFYLYTELKIGGMNGGVCFSRMSMDVRQMPRSPTS